MKGNSDMKLINFLFTTLLGSILIVSLLVALAIALYLLKIILEELYDNDGMEQFSKWLKDIGTKTKSLKKK